MKTKSIFVILLAMFFCLGFGPDRASAAPCECQVDQAVSQATPSISNSLQDICKDCGHSTSCCFSHTDLPMTGSAIAPELSPELPLVAQVIVGNQLSGSTALAHSGVNKAPPGIAKPTLVSLHQRLLI